jgi:hypothetical protein
MPYIRGSFSGGGIKGRVISLGLQVEISSSYKPCKVEGTNVIHVWIIEKIKENM